MPRDKSAPPKQWSQELLVHNYDLSNQTVVLTGGTGALGGTIANALVQLGAEVVIIDRDRERAAQSGKNPAHLYGNVLQKDTLVQAATTVRKQYGRVDALINAAGGNRPAATTSPMQPFFDLSDEALAHVFDVNALGTIRTCQAFGRMMAQQNKGSIINISSMAALRPLTRVGAYSAAKAAVSNFTCWLAVHLAQDYSPHIRVNAIAPGFFLTDQNQFLLTNKETGALTTRGQAIIEHTPMGRFGEPDDLIGTVLWLLTPLSEFVTGTVIPVDGGFAAFGGV